MGILMETTKVNSITANYRRRGADSEVFGAMGAPGERLYTDKIHTIAINTRETEFGSIVEPIPITLKAYKEFHIHDHSMTDNGYAHNGITPIFSNALVEDTKKPFAIASPDKKDERNQIARPPKKKWIKEYLEEEPKSPVSVRVTGVSLTCGNGVVRPSSPVTIVAPAPPGGSAVPPLEPVLAPAAPLSTPLLDFVQEHSRPRASNSHGPPQIPSPPSVSSNGSGSGSGGSGGAPRAGTREVHNKLEKNRRAHLKECFELLKRQLPATPDDKKTSNLSILGSAIRYIQVLRRKEREYEHEMEKLAREKISAQQRLAALKREVPMRPASRPRSRDAVVDDKERENNVNGQVVGIPLSVVRTSYGARHNTLTLSTLASADSTTQNGQGNGVTSTLSTLVHPAQIHLPLSQVVNSGGLVVGPAALQLLSSGGLRVLQAPVHTNGYTSEHNRIPKENGIVSPPPTSAENGVMVSGLTPIVVSQPAAHLLQTHTLTHKMVETHMVKGSVAPLTVSAQYLSATTIVKPVVVVTSAPSPSSPT